MQIDTNEVMTTKKAAEAIGIKPGELTAFVKKHGINVPRLGKTYLWTPGVEKEVRRIWLAVQENKCIHCGEWWDIPTQAAEILATDERDDGAPGA